MNDANNRLCPACKRSLQRDNPMKLSPSEAKREKNTQLIRQVNPRNRSKSKSESHRPVAAGTRSVGEEYLNNLSQSAPVKYTAIQYSPAELDEDIRFSRESIVGLLLSLPCLAKDGKCGCRSYECVEETRHGIQTTFKLRCKACNTFLHVKSHRHTGLVNVTVPGTDTQKQLSFPKIQSAILNLMCGGADKALRFATISSDDPISRSTAARYNDLVNDAIISAFEQRRVKVAHLRLVSAKHLALSTPRFAGLLQATNELILNLWKASEDEVYGSDNNHR